MALVDARCLDLRVTDDSASVQTASREAGTTGENGPAPRQFVTPEKNGPEPVHAAAARLVQDMIESGLVPAAVYEKALRAVTWPSYSSCPQNNYVLWKAFQVAGKAVCCKEVDGQCPYDHVAALHAYSTASYPVFPPECIFRATKEVESQEDYDDTKFPILVQFVINSRLYRFRLLQLGFIPDGVALSAVVNRVLADQGEARRFIEIDIQELGGTVFATPKLLTEFCAKYDIHVYGFEEAPARRVKALPPICDEWNELMKKRSEKSPRARRR